VTVWSVAHFHTCYTIAQNHNTFNISHFKTQASFKCILQESDIQKLRRLTRHVESPRTSSICRLIKTISLSNYSTVSLSTKLFST